MIFYLSEEKAKLLREINSQVTEKNSQLESFLTALQLDQLHLQDHDYLKLPKQLLECCASVNSSTRSEIPSCMKSIVSVSTQAKSILDEVQDILEEEHQSEDENDDDDDSSSDDEEDDARLSERKKRMRELIRRYERLSKSFNDANKSNAQLRDAFETVMKDLDLLSLPLK